MSDLASTEDSAPIGPSADEEAAFLSAERESGVTVAAMPATTRDEDETGELPPMEDLVKRIPAPARELIEDLFRARFVTVKRLPKASLKN